MVGKFMQQKARSATSVKIKPHVVTPITSFGVEKLNRQIAPKLKQNRLERLAGIRLYQTSRYK